MPIQRKNLFLTWGIRISLVPVILVLLALGLIAIVLFAICGVCGRFLAALGGLAALLALFDKCYEMRNAEWSLQINVKKTDSETGNQIAGDARYEIYQWDVVTGKYQPMGGYNTYSVQRQGDGTYAVINNAAYATNDTMRHTLYYTQRNEGRFILVETKAPAGYFGDWTDVDHPGSAGTPLGKRAYYVEITADNNNSVLWLGNGDYKHN